VGEGLLPVEAHSTEMEIAMQYMYFMTEGKLDLRALTVFGMNAKPKTDNPIGYFGTGLKYAIATLVRMDYEVKFNIDGRLWSVRKQKTNFRGVEFDGIELVRHKKFLPDDVRPLPFTTQLGKDWELWMAFRELYANTLDEHGKADLESDPLIFNRVKGYTLIGIEDDSHNMLADLWNNRDEIFLPPKDQSVISPNTKGDGEIEIRPWNGSRWIYYRTMRLIHLDKDPLFTYNVLSRIELTEDRTAKYPFQVDDAIKQSLVVLEDRSVIRKILAAGEDIYEGRLDFHDPIWHVPRPSPTWMSEVSGSLSRGEPVSSSVIKHYEKNRPRTADEKPPDNDQVRRWLRQAINNHDHRRVIELITQYRVQLLEILDDKPIHDPSNESIPTTIGNFPPNTSPMVEWEDKPDKLDVTDEIPF
jgi:hypothetical protein